MSFKLAAISLLITVAGFSLRAQQPDMLSVLQEPLANHQAAHPNSNLYLHLDKTTYTPEETIWLKAYLLGDTAQKAKVLYVRIVDDERNEVSGAQFPIYDVRAHGNIELSKPSNIEHLDLIKHPFRLDGNYTLYAYTDCMVALGDTNVFVQPIRISRITGRRLEATASVTDTAMLYVGGQVQVRVDVRESGSFAVGVKGEYQLLAGGKELKYGRLTTNIFGEAFVDFTYPDLADHESLKVKLLFTKGSDYTELALNLPHRGNPVTVNCLPEGGSPVPGGHVAIEVLDILGNPVQTALRLMVEDSTVASVTTDTLGMATVELPHAAGVRYTVKTLDGCGQTQIDVPSANRLGGFSLKLQQDSTGSRAMIRNLGSDVTALLVLRTNKEILWSTQQEILPGDSVMVVIPVGKYPKDVLSLAVFDRDGTPQAERLFLNRNDEPYQVTITTDRQQYGTHQKVTVSLSATDASGNPVVANFSVAATERDRNDSLVFRNILQQRYYGEFIKPVSNRLISAKSTTVLDRVLLGNGWLRNRRRSDMVYPSSGISAHLSNADGVVGTVPSTIKKIELRSFQGFKAEKNGIRRIVKTMTIEVDRESQSFFVPDSLLLSRSGQEWAMKIPTSSGWKYEYLVDWQNPDIGFDRTIVTGKQLYIPEVLQSFAIAALPAASRFDFNAMNLLDEVVVGRKEQAVSRTLKKPKCEQYEDRIHAEYLKMRDLSYMVESMIVKGKTYTWGYNPYDEPKTIICLGCGRYRDINYIKNITIPEEFPLPDYETYPTTELDMRSTVYWNSNVYTDADGTATFSFFTSDVTGEFEIVAQGLVESDLRPLIGTGGFNVINQ